MTYEVDYIIKVINASGVQAMKDMAAAVNLLGPGVKTLDRLNKRITTLNKTLNNRKWKLTFDTSQPEAKLTSLENRVAALRRGLTAVGGGAGSKGATTRGSTASQRQFIKHNGNLYHVGQGKPSERLLGRGYQWSRSSIPVQAFNPRELAAYNSLLSQQSKLRNDIARSQRAGATNTKKYIRQQKQLGRVSRQIGNMTQGYVATHYGTSIPAPVTGGGGRGGRMSAPRYRATPNNLGYKLLGPTPLTNNGGMAIDMLKGMGIAYGIAGIGQFFSNIINDSAEYDNTMQTVENILKSHDNRANFGNRFTQMSNTIRQVGIQTKFKVTEVADAAKFLAMAGLTVEDINSAIKPISNIALVGDTELGETADLVTNIMTAYNMQSHQMRKASDIMTNTFTMTNTTLPEIAEAYQYSASLLSAGGIGFEEATAAIGILGDAGIKGSQAGTTMRTILNNIINPRGKYRKQAWADTGIEKFDENGQVRSLAEIFTELAAKDLSVDQYYKLFDKTAAQGAVALATHTEKWNKVIEENFMSQNMADELAEKKKNTIKGLWAQLTSSVTDDGVKAFKGIEGDIKNILRNITSWLQQSSTQELMSDLFQSFMDFANIILDVTKYFYKFYSTFGFAIKWLIQFQLYMWPVIKTITTLKTAFMGLMAVTRLAAGIRALALAFTGLSAAVGGRAAWAMVLSNLGGYFISGGAKPLLPWTSGNVIANQNNSAYTTTTANGQVAYYTQDGRPLVAPPAGGGKPPRTGPRLGAGFSNFGRGAAAAGFTLAGAGLGYMVGNALNSDGGDTWGSAIGSVVGAGASAWAMSGFAGAGALLSNPIGWGILVAGALTAVGVHIFNRMKEIEKANEATRKWKESFDNLHIASLDLTKDNGLLISYMRTYNNSLLSEQQQLEQSIQTFNRYWEAKKGPDAIKDEGAVAGLPTAKDFNNLLDIADWNTGKYGAMESRFKAMGGTIATAPNGHTTWTLGNHTFATTDYASLNEDEATRVALAAFGASDVAPLENAERELLKAVTSAQSAAYIQDRLKKVKDTYLPAISDEFSNDLSSEDVKNWSMNELLQSKWVQATFRPRIEKAISNWDPFINAMTSFENGTPLGSEAMQDALKPLLGGLFDRSKVGLVGSPQWYAKIQDIQTNYSRYGMTKEAADHYVSETFNQLVELYNKMDDKFKPMFGGFLDRSIWNGALSANESLMSGGYYPGNAVGMKAKDSRGVEYTWSQLTAPYALGTYGWLDKNGNQYFPDTRSGNLDLLSANGNPFSGNDQYLSPIAYASRFAAQYPASNAFAQSAPATGPLAFNAVPGPWSSGYVFPSAIPNFSAYGSPMPNVNSSAYSYSNGLLAQVQPRDTKIEFTAPTVKIDHVTIENHGSEMDLGQFNNLLTQSILTARNTAISTPTT